MLSPEQVQKLRDKYQISSSSVSPTAPSKPGYFQNVKNSYLNAGSDIISGIKSGAGDIQKGFGEKDPTLEGGLNVLKGVARSGLRTVGGVAKAAFAPIAEAPVIKQGLEKVGEGIAQIPGFEQVTTKLSDLAQKNPEVARDIEDIINTVTLGAGKTVEKPLAIAGEKALQTATKGLSKTAAPIANTIKKGAGNIADSEKIMQRVARIPKPAQAKFEKTSGESVGSYLNKRNIYGNTEQISEQLYKRFETSKEAADKALSKLKGEYKPLPLKNALEDLVKREKRVSAAGSRSKDYTRTIELANKYNKSGLTMSEINEVKRLFERNVRLDFVKQNLPEGVARSTNIDNALRQWQFNQAEKMGLKNLPEINRETRLSKELLDAIGKESAGSAGNNAVSLTDFIVLSGGDPTAIGMFLTKKFGASKKIQSAIAKKMYKGKRIGMPKAEIGEAKPGLSDFNKKYDSFNKGAVPQTAKPATTKSMISKELEPLAQEAGKYKSVEDFVKAKVNAYHGTDAIFDVFDGSKAGTKGTLYGKGTYLSNSKEIAGRHGKNLKEVFVDKSSFLKPEEKLTANQIANLKRVLGEDYANWDNIPNSDWLWKRLELTHKNPEKLLQKAGINGVEYAPLVKGGANYKNVVVFNTKPLLTKSQLTDLWNKVNNK